MASWSVILNVLLLAGVMIAIFRLMYAKRKAERMYTRKAPMPTMSDLGLDDDIIAVRKINAPETDSPVLDDMSSISPDETTVVSQEAHASSETDEAEIYPQSVYLFILAKDDKQFAGYELLQTILAAGLRYGEGHIFHRHQHKNGQGPIICSLATATADGTFDLQNIGAVSVHGLCMFMDASGSPSIDAERLEIMVESAKQLAEGLDAHLLDDKRKSWNDLNIPRYQGMLSVKESALVE